MISFPINQIFGGEDGGMDVNALILGPYLGGATRVVMQPCRSPIHFIRFHLCRSEPKKKKTYFHSGEMRLLKRRRFLRVVALFCQSPILTFLKSNIAL
ncbi:hypothetical protein Hanom_Chr03g00191261 [Helianthus anomalus]